MDSLKLREIRDNLYVLPTLHARAEKHRSKIYEVKQKVDRLLKQYEKECMDVEQLKNSSFSATLLKLVGKYEGKLEKESEEILAAKLEYDAANEEAVRLQSELDELTERIYTLEQERRLYETEIKNREQMLLNQMDSEKSAQYLELEKTRIKLKQQMVEIDEAVRAGKRAQDIAKQAMSHLQKADNWATYDMWTRGGVFSHMAKYEHIDKAEMDFNRLSSQIKAFQKELSDVQLGTTIGLSEIDSSTRTIDFWFDNIFTDLKVRDQIRGNSEQVRSLYGKVDRAISTLEKKKSDIHQRLDELEREKNELLIGLLP